MQAFPQLRQFWSIFQSELANKSPYQASIGSMRFKMQELQEANSEAQKLQSQEGYKKVEGVLHYQGLSFVPKAIRTKLISCHHNDFLAGHFGIKKACKLLAWKCFWLSLRHNVGAYVKGFDVCFALKAVRYKPYSNLQSLPVPSHWWKDLLMNFVIGLLILTNCKQNSYDSILVIIDRLTKMVHYKPVKITINAPGLAQVIINVVVRHHGLLNSIMTDMSSLSTSKFRSLFCYFLNIKRWIFIAFHLQIDGKTEKESSTIKGYLRVFVNFK